MKYFKEYNNSLIADFECKNFESAIKFINQVANIAEISDHHPDILLYNYKYVKVTCTSYNNWSTITEKDYAIAKLIESSYRK